MTSSVRNSGNRETQGVIFRQHSISELRYLNAKRLPNNETLKDVKFRISDLGSCLNLDPVHKLTV